MKKKLYFGSNLKMYKTTQETVLYLRRLTELTRDISREQMELFILPSFTALEKSAETVDQERILLGAQNMCWKEKGPFTGEISPLMLREAGIHLVMVGHSERRQLFGETDFEEGQKAACALQHGFTVLLCVGETMEEKEYGISSEVIRKQLKAGLHEAREKDADNIWIAYEPVWAVGEKGRAASGEYAEKIHQTIKECLRELFGEKGRKIPVLYGGSVSQSNAEQFILQPDIDGLYVGRAAWDADEFNALIRKAVRRYKNYC